MSDPVHAVFISYASQDSLVAERLGDALHNAQIEVWLDQTELQGGEDWDKNIRRQIRECALFVALVSRNSEARAEGYFRLEWRLAAERCQLMADDEPFLLPIVIDGSAPATARVPDRFRTVQWMRLPDGCPSPEFVDRVARLLRQEDRTAVSPALAAPRIAPPAATYWRRRIVLAVIGAFAVAVAVAGSMVVAHLSPRSVASNSASAEPSVAVLPFVDLSEKRDQGYFVDGLSEEMIDLLTQVPGLHVRARTSSFYFRNRPASLGEIGRALTVTHLLEGSVRKSGNMLRITTQLVRVDSGDHVWSKTFESPLGDVFRIQDEIANRVVAALRGSLFGPTTSRSSRTGNTEAYSLYLQARALERSAGEGDAVAAQQSLRRALTLDPTFATGWAELAHAIMSDVGWHDTPTPADPCVASRAPVNRALELDPTLSEPHRVYSEILMQCEQDYSGAETELRRALAVDPGPADTWAAYATLRVHQGRYAEAEHMAREAVSRDPLNPWRYVLLASAQGNAGDLAAAEASYRRAVEIDPMPAGLHALHANSLLSVNAPADALVEVEREGDDQFRRMTLPLVFDALGRRREAEVEIRVFEQRYADRDALTLAEFYACRDDEPHALEWLDVHFRQADARRPGLVPEDDLPNRMGCFRHIAGNARYQAMVANHAPH